MVQNTGTIPKIIIEDMGLHIRKMKVRAKQLELSIENAEIRLIDLDIEKKKTSENIDAQKAALKRMNEEIKELEKNG